MEFLKAVRAADGPVRNRPRLSAAATVLILGLALAGCGSDEAAPHEPELVRVGVGDVDEALSEAGPGDVILLEAGVYEQTIQVDTPGITLRGEDRDAVVVDGKGERGDGIVVTADDVAVENLTVRGHLLNGVLVTGMTGEDGTGLGRGSTGYTTLDPETTPPVENFRVRHVTAVRNGLYGIYAFHATTGLIEDNYASGGADSGIYVGQCNPCRTLVRGNKAEHNAVGFENANASGEMYVVGNDFSGNRVGMTITSDYKEALVPQSDSVVIGNRISDNNDEESPVHAEGAFGIGIGLAGATNNRIERNLVSGNETAGLLLAESEDLPAEGNGVRGNEFAGNGVDLANVSSKRAPAKGNCLEGNLFTSIAPESLAEADGCGGAVQPSTELDRDEAPPGLPFFESPLPGPKDGMEDVETLDRGPAVEMPGRDVIDSIALPTGRER
ncbi:right-handed parallel beta-helix repeat-containing protein [Salininema proteolyticum]|uniref:Nitrous oxide reductase family maturation protein NosD n=1 Tax=Salininema proteolyticum TaxID=1607685 RepID=A0ABV8U069_9ACTN